MGILTTSQRSHVTSQRRRGAVLACLVTLAACAARRVAPVVPAPSVPAPTAPETTAAVTTTEDAAHEPDDPPNSRREDFRGCSVAVPREGVREDIEHGLRVVLPTDDGPAGVAVTMQRWSGGAAWAGDDFLRGMRMGIEASHGEVLLMHPPAHERDAIEVLWRQHIRVDRRERTRVMVSGRRVAMVACSAGVERFEAIEPVCDAALESLTLTQGAEAPTAAAPGSHWIGGQGRYVRVPDGWFTVYGRHAIASVTVGRDASTSPLIDVIGIDTELSATAFLTQLRVELATPNRRFTRWEVDRRSADAKVEFDDIETSDQERYTRQRVLREGWRLCSSVCSGPESVVRDHDGPCTPWVMSLRVRP